jgi:beta-lactamase class D
MAKKLVRLTENDLHRIIKESVNRVIKEYYKKSGKEGFEMEHDYVSHGNDNVNDRKGAAAMNALGCNGEEMEGVAKRDKGYGRYNRYGYED